MYRVWVIVDKYDGIPENTEEIDSTQVETFDKLNDAMDLYDEIIWRTSETNIHKND